MHRKKHSIYKVWYPEISSAWGRGVMGHVPSAGGDLCIFSHLISAEKPSKGLCRIRSKFPNRAQPVFPDPS